MNVEQQIRSALRGQRIVVVGGEPRAAALARIATSLGLAEIIHCPTRRSDASPRCFASQLRAPGIALVVWALGLSRTHHGEELHRQCRLLRLPWVDFFHIPHPNALVARIASLRLLDALTQRRALVEGSVAPSAAPIGGAA